MTSRDLRRLPKAHLHLHLEQSIRPDTAREFAAAQGLPAPVVRGFDDFGEFDRVARGFAGLLTTPDHLRRLVMEIAEDAAEEGCVWIEPAVWLPLHRARIGPDEFTLEVLVDAAAKATTATGVGIGFLLATDRTAAPARALEQARIGARFADRGVTSFGLHNDERGFPPEPFVDAFRAAEAAGLMLAPHGGELAGAESVRGCVEALRASRVQHGIRAVDDDSVLELLREHEVCLDICPTSNVLLTAAVGLEAHPLPRLLQAGVRVSLNADNPAMFGCSIASEYETCRSAMMLTDEQLAGIARTSIRASAAPAATAASALADIDAWLASER
jgi:adenosine deaminase